jgi:hypothetical protein
VEIDRHRVHAYSPIGYSNPPAALKAAGKTTGRVTGSESRQREKRRRYGITQTKTYGAQLRHETKGTKHQAPSTKHQTTNTKQQTPSRHRERRENAIYDVAFYLIGHTKRINILLQGTRSCQIQNLLFSTFAQK